MIDLNKHLEFFNPFDIKDDIHIIGVGAVGSFVALQLAKLGLSRINIWDFDTVDEHNITNQVYGVKDIGRLKTDAMKDHILGQNPDCDVITHGKYENQPLSGYIFMEVDSVELRHRIAEDNMFNRMIKYIFDGRIGLSSGQVISVDWQDNDAIENYLKLCDFKDSDADVAVSACGMTLSVSPSVFITAAEVVAMFINVAKNNRPATIVAFDAFSAKMRGM
jgi:molybdopterin/thiamine biosynthesis adenylyltransferase